MLGEVNRRVVESFSDPEVFQFFVKCIQRCCPKSDAQARGELKVTVDFFKNFTGDRVRYLASSTRHPGDHNGQFTTSYRFPYGATAIITPFNFPLEIPMLQTMGSLFMGNKVFLKPDFRTAFPVEQFVRLLHHCGLPKEDIDFMYSSKGDNIEKVLTQTPMRQTLFTGSSHIAEHLAEKLRGKIRIEDAGYDWKILGPDVPKDESDVKYVAWQIENDMFGFSG